MTITFAKAYAQIMTQEVGATFYASDFGIAGGTIAGLKKHQIIEPTGNQKVIAIPHPYNENLFVKGVVKEWRVKDPKTVSVWASCYRERLEKEFRKFVASLNEIISIVNTL